MKHILKVEGEKTVSQAISQNVLGVSRAAISALFKQGEVRLNGAKCTSDKPVNYGDEVSVFVPKKYLTPLKVDVVYVDKNILIVDKPPLMDVENNLTSHVKKDYPCAMAVHRLDTNTRGLVIFALNDLAFNALLAAFKDRLIDKFYHALVKGDCALSGERTAYLVKDSANAKVRIFNEKLPSSKKIVTHFEVLSSNSAQTLLNVKLITGRTHQIRAHLSFLGWPIIGDGKYGTKAGANGMKLAAYKLIFNYMPPPLGYLNGKVIKIDTNFID